MNKAIAKHQITRGMKYRQRRCSSRTQQGIYPFLAGGLPEPGKRRPGSPSWLVGASIETTLELWVSSLRDAKGRIGPLFHRKRRRRDGFWTGFWEANPAGRAGCALRRRAIPAHGVNRRSWAAADGTRIQMLADGDAVLVIDETGFLNRARRRAALRASTRGSAARITCRIGVFASYVSCHGHAFIDRRLYLPKAWTDDPERMAAAHAPGDVWFATKPQIARATAAKIRNRAPVSFVMVRGRSTAVTGRDSDASPARSAGPARDRHLNCARTGYWMLARVRLCGHCGVPSPRRPGTSRQLSTPRQEE